jgi:ribosomal protein S18 acetylase RimI-like enzyme
MGTPWDHSNNLPDDSRNEQFFTGATEHHYQLQYQHYPMRINAPHEIVAFEPGSNGIVGHLSWNNEDGQINEIHVDPDHRHKGLATRMYLMGKRVAAANPHIIPPVHSNEVRTEAGDEWAKSTPDYTPIAKSKIKKLRNWRYND